MENQMEIYLKGLVGIEVNCVLLKSKRKKPPHSSYWGCTDRTFLQNEWSTRKGHYTLCNYFIFLI